jgi:uncharacterized membrane protein SpoIIM required for sporulation
LRTPMVSPSFNRLAAVWWITLLVSVGVFFIFALLTPEVALFDNASERDAAIQNIKSETNTDQLQQTVKMYISAGYGTGATATGLCRIALVTFLLFIIGSVVGLVQIRRLRRQLNDEKDVA